MNRPFASVLDRLASALGRNDERPNVELAEEIVARDDSTAISELAEALDKDRPVAHDAIKVLYEVGARRPEMLAPQLYALLPHLGSSSNRMVWGALTALSAIAPLIAEELRPHLNAILAAADAGSVIAKDHANRILCALAASDPTLLDIAIARLATAAPNQFVTYAEEIGAVVDSTRRDALLAVIAARRPGVDGKAKLARLDRLVNRLKR